jgi:hypothetical protein
MIGKKLLSSSHVAGTVPQRASLVVLRAALGTQGEEPIPTRRVRSIQVAAKMLKNPGYREVWGRADKLGVN